MHCGGENRYIVLSKYNLLVILLLINFRAAAMRPSDFRLRDSLI